MENKTSNKLSQKMIKNNFFRILFVILFIVFFGLINVISLRGEYLSIKEVSEDYLDIFFKNLKIEYTVFGVNFLIVFIIFFITNLFIKKGLKKFFEDDKKEVPRLPNKSIAFIISIISSFIAKEILSEKFMLFKNVAWFGINDPIFDNDVSFYMFILPFIKSLIVYSSIMMILNLIYVALYNVVTFNVYLDGVDRKLLRKSVFIKQIIFDALIIVILCSGYIWINTQSILTDEFITIENSEKTGLVGAGATDITVKFIGNRIFSIVIIFVALFLINSINKKDFKQGAITVCLIPMYLVGLFFVMIYTDYIYMGSNELDKEKDYIGYNIDFTQKAYGIDINQVDLNDYDTITREQIEQNQEFINNIPLLTKDVVKKSLNQKQEDSMYYSYENSRLAYYDINGKKQLLYITPREVITQNRSYNNLTYEYTHGYSVILSSVSNIDKSGYAEQISLDTIGKQFITEPRIYFGLQNNSEIIVNSKYGKEYDNFISANRKEENVYDGEAGLELNFKDRLVLGLKNGNLKLAFSKYINSESKIISERNILDRVKTVLPNIIYDEEPYLVVSEKGRLIWIVDGYTVSKEYPYSQITVCNGQKINYIRNSVKVLIDAYDGTTKFYITDKTDPIIRIYKELYPTLFSEEEIPDDICVHFTYPKLLYEAQAKMVNLYHGTSEDVLYRGDNVWQITTETTSKNTSISPYYTLVKTVDFKEPELGLMVTYNKYGKQSMTAYLVGTCRNGKNNLTLYKFGSNSNVAGISQVNNQIEQDETISLELENLNTTGTKLIKEMEIIPVENTLLYVEKVYQEMLNEPDGIPTLKKIIVASGNVLAMGDTLEDAISNLYSDYSVELDFFDADDMEALIDSIIKANNNLKESLDSNDFEMIGKDLSRLETLIDQLEVLNKQEEKDNSESKDEKEDISEKAQEEIVQK